jgi:BirA family biotin operon repressor/biotin-[acetyl-CoA-carboxylase] ligase
VTTSPFLSRIERLASLPSTNDVVAGWLDAGVPEVCVASADVQTAGRGRMGRTWVAPPGAALLVSSGFRPTWIDPERVWRIGGVLGEATGVGTPDPRVVVGIGVNAGWREPDFPPDLAAGMTSLQVASGGRPIDAVGLLQAFLDRLEPRIVALRAGRFDVADWTARQLVRGRRVRLVRGTDPDDAEEVLALGADPLTGALVVEDPSAAGGERQVHAGEIARLLAEV